MSKKGYKQTKKHIEKRRKICLGQKHSEETKEKMRQIAIGRKFSKETRMKMSKAKKGKDTWNKGKKDCYSKVTIEKMSKAKKGKHYSIKTEFKNGLIPWNKDKNGLQISWSKGLTKETDERVKKISENKIGEKNPSWKGGISFEPYNKNWNSKLRKKIKESDNYICQECKTKFSKNTRKLDVHHIDYNKKNNSLNNLISLCKSCHGKTGFNRKNWTNYFKRKVGAIS